MIFVDRESEPRSRVDDVGEQGDEPQQLVIAQILLQKITDAWQSLKKYFGLELFALETP